MRLPDTVFSVVGVEFAVTTLRLGEDCRMKSLNLPVYESEAHGDLGLSSVEKGVNYLYRSWQWFRNQIVQDVPADFAVCEFECRKPYCTIGYEEKCEVYLCSKAQSQ